jgi:hypothetical protein
MAVSGNQLYEDCTANRGFDRGECFSYITGATEAWSNAPVGLCLPDGVSRGQAQDLVMTYMRDHPAERHLDAAYLILRALLDAWRCR